MANVISGTMHFIKITQKTMAKNISFYFDVCSETPIHADLLDLGELDL